MTATSRLPIAVRAYAPSAGCLPAADDEPHEAEQENREPKIVVVFDCETTVDPGQQLTFRLVALLPRDLD